MSKSRKNGCGKVDDYYFQDKEGLYRAVLERSHGELGTSKE
ncbi:hypothetical protein [Brunnivagina elsteri]|nr:hypothetical protein [Calothrix elsteri]